jgi:hypothetical protein
MDVIVYNLSHRANQAGTHLGVYQAFHNFALFDSGVPMKRTIAGSQRKRR